MISHTSAGMSLQHLASKHELGEANAPRAENELIPEQTMSLRPRMTQGSSPSNDLSPVACHVTGYMAELESIGQKFDVSDLVWQKLTEPSSPTVCNQSVCVCVCLAWIIDAK